jgi:hypothetical protein
MDVPVYKKLIDIENQKENPFGTAQGQDVVSVSESFWSRLFREGRERSNAYIATTMSTVDGTGYNYGPSITTSLGCYFYPRFVSVSASVDAELTIVVSTGISLGDVSNSGNVTYVAWCKAGQPFNITFDGDIRCNELSTVSIKARTTTAGGKLYGTIYGVEVPWNA